MTETPTWPRHVIAAGAMIQKDQSILMVRTPRRGWEIPGGQVEEHEDVVAAVLREIREEAHVLAEVQSLASLNYNLSASRLILDFTGSWLSGEPAISDETLEAEWVPRDDAVDRITHPMYRLRVQHLLDFDGRVLHRTFTTEPFQIVEERYL